MPTPRSPFRINIALVALSLLFSGAVAAYAEEQAVTSTISAVAVFSDRAQVTRSWSESLKEGEQVLVFDNLPEAVQRTSLTVEGSGDMVLRDVKFGRSRSWAMPIR